MLFTIYTCVIFVILCRIHLRS